MCGRFAIDDTVNERVTEFVIPQAGSRRSGGLVLESRALRQRKQPLPAGATIFTESAPARDTSKALLALGPSRFHGLLIGPVLQNLKQGHAQVRNRFSQPENTGRVNPDIQIRGRPAGALATAAIRTSLIAKSIRRLQALSAQHLRVRCGRSTTHRLGLSSRRIGRLSLERRTPPSFPGLRSFG